MVGIVDMHCHIIPGIDDGAQSLEESKEMLEIAYAEGIRVIVATPHFRRGMFESSQEDVANQYQAVKKMAKQIAEDMEILLGCEYFAETEMTQRLKGNLQYTIAETKAVLIEFSTETEFSYMRAIVQELVSGGYQPVLAHAERYGCLYKLTYVEELVSMGAKIQLSADSIIGKNGLRIKGFCKRMMKKDLLSFVGTDGHGSEIRQPRMEKCATYIEKKQGCNYAYKVLVNNPRELLKRN